MQAGPKAVESYSTPDVVCLSCVPLDDVLTGADDFYTQPGSRAGKPRPWCFVILSGWSTNQRRRHSAQGGREAGLVSHEPRAWCYPVLGEVGGKLLGERWFRTECLFVTGKSPRGGGIERQNLHESVAYKNVRVRNRGYCV